MTIEELDVSKIASLSSKEFRNSNKVLCIVKFKDNKSASFWTTKEEFIELERRFVGTE